MGKSFKKNFVLILKYIDSYLLDISLYTIWVVVFGMILVRIIPHLSFQASDLIIKIMLLAMTSFAIEPNIDKNKYVRMDFFINKINKKNRGILEIVSYFGFLFYLFFILITSLEVSIFYIESKSMPGALKIPFFWLRFPVILGCISGIIILLGKIQERNIFKKR